MSRKKRKRKVFDTKQEAEIYAKSLKKKGYAVNVEKVGDKFSIKELASGVFHTFPQKRMFDGDEYYLIHTTTRKDDVRERAEKERKRGYYIRVTYNKYIKTYFVWRG